MKRRRRRGRCVETRVGEIRETEFGLWSFGLVFAYHVMIRISFLVTSFPPKE
jgi:hypothetical protein